MTIQEPTYILQTNRSSVLLLLTSKPFSAAVEKGLFHLAGTSALPVTTALPYAAMSGTTMPRKKAAMQSALSSGTTASVMPKPCPRCSEVSWVLLILNAQKNALK